jgi:hypothetical protein
MSATAAVATLPVRISGELEGAKVAPDRPHVRVERPWLLLVGSRPDDYHRALGVVGALLADRAEQQLGEAAEPA